MSRENFFVANGVNYAHFTEQKPKFVETLPSSLTRAQKEGLRYEKKAHEYLQSLLLKENDENFELKISPWVMYKTIHDPSERIRFCQPDAVLISEKNKRIILIEIKYQHTNEAWKQLRLLYEPVLKFIYPDYTIACLEICRWLDPHAVFTGHYYYNEHPLKSIANSLGVHIYNPRRKAKL